MSASRHTYAVIVNGSEGDRRYIDTICRDRGDHNKWACYGSKKAAEDMRNQFIREFGENEVEYTVIQLR